MISRDIDRMRDWILTLPAKERYEKSDLLRPEILLHQDRGMEIFYAPFDHINEHARVALVGVTPGWTQMETSMRVFRRTVLGPGSIDQGLAAVKREASFAGSMRKNLVTMLDELGLPAAVGVETTAELFGPRADLAQTTSAVRYPVFTNGHNYTGHNPNLVKSPILRGCVLDLLAEELQRAGSSLVVPLGGAAQSAVSMLVGEGVIESERCLIGFPHPSGANAHRHRQFEQGKAEMSGKIARWS